MFRRIAVFVQKDLIKALRDNIIVYVLLSPLLLAVVTALFIPSLQGMTLTFALDAGAEAKVIEGFRAYGKVELYPGRRAVVERVERPDEVAGVVREGDQYAVVVEGNEAGDVGRLTGAVLDRILTERPLAASERVSLGKTSPLVKETAASLLVLSTVLIAGVMIGFAIIDEKETGVMRALAVSPLRMFEFVFSHAVIALLVAEILGVISSVIVFGAGVDYAGLIAGVLFSVGLSLLFGFLVGGLADNQLAGIAVLKVAMLVFTAIPLGSLFVPAASQWPFYPFPNYWALQVFQNVFAGTGTLGYWPSCLATFALSAAALLALAPVLAKRLNLRPR